MYGIVYCRITLMPNCLLSFFLGGVGFFFVENSACHMFVIVLVNP